MLASLSGKYFSKILLIIPLLSLLQSSPVLLHLDVVSNTGPAYTINRTTFETNNQGVTRFSQAAGIQCTCNYCFYSLFSSQIYSFNSWKSYDLDHVLLETDKLSKLLDKSSLLAGKQLRYTINLLKVEIHVKFSQLETDQTSTIINDQ